MEYEKRARKYRCEMTQKLLGEIDPVSMEQTKSRMVIAMLISDGIINKKLTKIEFAKQAKVEPSVVTRWLSGTHNFTINTLVEIELLLNIKLLNV